MYRLTNKPDTKPSLDFDYYKTRIPDKAFVDKLEKFVSQIYCTLLSWLT